MAKFFDRDRRVAMMHDFAVNDLVITTTSCGQCAIDETKSGMAIFPDSEFDGFQTEQIGLIVGFVDKYFVESKAGGKQFQPVILLLDDRVVYIASSFLKKL